MDREGCEDGDEDHDPDDDQKRCLLVGDPVPVNGLGLPQSSRVAEVRVLVGFHSAIGNSQAGKLRGGTCL